MKCKQPIIIERNLDHHEKYLPELQRIETTSIEVKLSINNLITIVSAYLQNLIEWHKTSECSHNRQRIIHIAKKINQIFWISYFKRIFQDQYIPMSTLN